MPELPEVETVKEVLKKQILNKEFKFVDIYLPKIIGESDDELETTLPGQKINDIKRRGKWIIFDLDNYYLLSHLRMEGKYFIKGLEDKEKHEHVIFTFTDDTSLRYHDTRQFGKLHLYNKKDYNLIKPLAKLGPEPWDENLTVKYLKEKLKTKRIPIKSSLLDQTILVGLGNIYVNEVLFLSNVNPIRPSNKVTNKELKVIIENTKKVLEKAIISGGTTIRSYTSSLGVTGMFQNELYVHEREGEPCHVCQTKIEKIKVGGRGTYFCKNCQKK